MNLSGIVYISDYRYSMLTHKYLFTDRPHLLVVYFLEDDPEIHESFLYFDTWNDKITFRQKTENEILRNYKRMSDEIGIGKSHIDFSHIISLYFRRLFTYNPIQELGTITKADILRDIGSYKDIIDYIYNDKYLRNTYWQGPPKPKRPPAWESRFGEKEIDKHIGSFKFSIEREPENTNTNTFDYIHAELGICGNNIDKRKWCRDNAKEIVRAVVKKLEQSKRFTRFGVPSNFIKCSNAIYKTDDILMLTFEIKKVS